MDLLSQRNTGKMLYNNYLLFDIQCYGPFSTPSSVIKSKQLNFMHRSLTKCLKLSINFAYTYFILFILILMLFHMIMNVIHFQFNYFRFGWCHAYKFVILFDSTVTSFIYCFENVSFSLSMIKIVNTTSNNQC